MKRVTAYTTSDAGVYLSRREAHRHADKRYGDALTKHAHALARCNGKFSAFLDYLEAHTATLAELDALKRDRDTLESDE